ncbi:MAG: CvpA family protein [Lachnospiraceae bacterium]|nr:CvpA family protein [Lachnospiraceae bacterium]
MYYIALIIIGLIFIWRMVTGFKKGMVQELLSLVAAVVAGVCMVLILGAVGSYFEDDIGQVIKTVLVLLVVCVVYRLVNILFTSLKLISKLPIVKSVDKLLGIVVGFAEAGVIVVLLIQLLKNWGLSILS